MGSIATRGNDIFYILICSLWCRGLARRWVPPLNMHYSTICSQHFVLGFENWLAVLCRIGVELITTLLRYDTLQVFNLKTINKYIESWVPPLNTQCFLNSAESRERCVLTLGFLCLTCCVRNTVWSWFKKQKSQHNGKTTGMKQNRYKRCNCEIYVQPISLINARYGTVEYSFVVFKGRC